MRICRPRRWCGRRPALIHRCTVFSETLRAAATTAMVKKRGRGGAFDPPVGADASGLVAPASLLAALDASLLALRTRVSAQVAVETFAGQSDELLRFSGHLP